MANRVVMEIVGTQFRNMDEPFDIHLIECDEGAKGRDTGNGAIKDFADPILHVVALEPGFDIARGVIGTALSRRAMQTNLFPSALISREFDLLKLQCIFDGAMHEQIWVAPDRRREVRVILVRQTEVADVVWAVDGLLHRAQQNRLQQ